MALGTLVAVSGASAYWELRQSQHWLEVSGIVTSSSVNKWRGSKGGTSYMPCISYQYSIGGEAHSGNAVRFGPMAVDRAEAEEAVTRFSAGSQAVIYVDPEDHARSVLDRTRVTGAVKWKVGTGVGLLLAGFSLLVALRRANL